MSKAAAREYINNAIQANPAYVGLKNVRKGFDANIHTLDVSYNTFKVNNDAVSNKLDEQTLRELHGIFISLLKSKVDTYSSLIAADAAVSPDELFRKPYQCILIVQGTTISIIGYDYKSIRILVTEVEGSNQLLRTQFGRAETGISPETGEVSFRSLLELGHTGMQTPFAETLRQVYNFAPVNSVLRSALQIQIDKLYAVQAELSYTFLNTSNNSKLGKNVINLVIQPKELNAKFSLEEYKIYSQALRDIRKSLDKPNIPGSNTLIQDGRQFANDALLSVLTKKKVSTVKAHSPVSDKIKIPVKKPKVSVTGYKEASSTISAVKNATYSLASLQQLLNDSLQSVISANMGSGSSRNTLNYRTGRFAASANVERLTQSREGMITAFYSYMKYPYQTFEPGYAQGSPKTRDPKLLIAKSIREIAATKVANRMRSVLI